MLDEVIIPTVDMWSLTTLREQFSGYKPVDFEHYIAIQLKWLADVQWHLGEHLHREPTDEELLNVWMQSNHSERYKAWYCLKYPYKVVPL